MDPSDPAYAGQELYSRAFLRIYDPLILGFYGNVVWRCPTSRLVQHYARHVGHRHLDVGPGTGYFLEHARLARDTQITLLDPNRDVLAHAARRLAHLHPWTLQADVLKPLPVPAGQRFDSAALNYVLHCLPGPPERKAAAVQHVAAVLQPGGVLFGATVLGAAGPRPAVTGGAVVCQPPPVLRQPGRHRSWVARHAGRILRAGGHRGGWIGRRVRGPQQGQLTSQTPANE
jgi:SAM-dependent methyltransferase